MQIGYSYVGLPMTFASTLKKSPNHVTAPMLCPVCARAARKASIPFRNKSNQERLLVRPNPAKAMSWPGKLCWGQGFQ
jgi:hypothetical protein